MSKTPFAEKFLSVHPVNGQKKQLRFYDADQVDAYLLETKVLEEQRRQEVRQLKVTVIDQKSKIFELRSLLEAKSHPANKQP